MYFLEHPEAFYELAGDIFDMDKYEPTPTHHFLKLLQDKNLLQLNMTQNIDNLEEKAGLDLELRVVQCHGVNRGAHCAKCFHIYNESDLK